MTFRCQWETRGDAGVRDFTTEAAAEAFAVAKVTEGFPHVVVFEVGDEWDTSRASRVERDAG